MDGEDVSAMLSTAFWIAIFVIVWLIVSGQIRFNFKRPPKVPSVEWSPVDVPAEWGTIEDCDGGRIERQDRGVVFHLPGGVHELQGNGKQNAPRVLRAMSGDFALEIDLTGEWNPRSGGSFPFAPFQGCGILVWTADSEFEFLRFERARIKTPVGGQVTYVHLEGHAARFPYPLGSVKLRDEEFPTLRIERHGQRIFAMIRIGVADWRQVGVAPALSNEINVGVAAISNTNEPFAALITRVQFFQPRDGTSAKG